MTLFMAVCSLDPAGTLPSYSNPISQATRAACFASSSNPSSSRSRMAPIKPPYRRKGSCMPERTSKASEPQALRKASILRRMGGGIHCASHACKPNDSGSSLRRLIPPEATYCT
eukprot:CAMPEP_0167796786 /NCGR_PEP_ID=MMETSP0111_2-20121227/15256_1 /TAXON_ID=91324 /ORGANISM="Lotharella globosa, Strain CCCM811" /LENGTH=113 /DNA_ID=CAMNT_0007690747 /DNA_START=164 /DNA_END=505 /DNA_ORIENTATION=+